MKVERRPVATAPGTDTSCALIPSADADGTDIGAKAALMTRLPLPVLTVRLAPSADADGTDDLASQRLR